MASGMLGRYTPRTLGREVIMIVLTAIFVVPFLIVLALSLKSSLDVLVEPNTPPTHPEWSNYSIAWDAGMGSALWTSLVITLVSVLVLIVVGALCAYVLARRASRLSTGLYLLFLLGVILPFQLAIVPIYSAMRSLHLTGSIFGMILLYSGLLMPLSVFLFGGFIRALPRDYEEASQVDGASFWRTFRRVVFPLLRPITGTVAVLTGVVIWTDFFASLIFLQGSSHETLPVAIHSYADEYQSQWNLVFAAVVISVLPVLAIFIFAQRRMMRGFSGGVRG